MGFVWADFLDLAQALCEPGDDEKYQNARSRTAISRAYYAAYHAARELLEARGEYAPERGESTHEYVREKFLEGKDDGRRKIGLALDRLRRVRNEADYDRSAPGMTPSNALKETEAARRAIEKIKKLRQDGKSGSA